MVATSVNGFSVLEDNRITGSFPRLRKWMIPGTERHLLMRDGSVGFILTHHALWFHENIERLDLGIWDEWGWALRPVRGQTSGFSNHASGTAEDLNATRHPQHVAIWATFTGKQIKHIRRRMKFYRFIHWGGEWTRPDGMHFEIPPGTKLATCERVAKLLMRTPRGKRILAANPGAKKAIES